MNVEGLGQYISYVNYWFNHLKKGKRKTICKKWSIKESIWSNQDNLSDPFKIEIHENETLKDMLK
jgi:TfoX/Sxy family transcriptional regulator of competence genes